MQRDTISINKELIPYNFDILLADELFNLRIDYNNSSDLFTVSLYKDGNLVCIEPIVYGVRLFKDVFQNENYPSIDIIPLDESKKNTRVTFDNLSNTVSLIIDNGGDTIE